MATGKSGSKSGAKSGSKAVSKTASKPALKATEKKTTEKKTTEKKVAEKKAKGGVKAKPKALPKAAAKSVAKGKPGKSNAQATKTVDTKKVAVKATPKKAGATKATVAKASVRTPDKKAKSSEKAKAEKTKSGKTKKAAEELDREESLSRQGELDADAESALDLEAVDEASDAEGETAESEDTRSPSSALLEAMRPTPKDADKLAGEKKKKKDDLKIDRNGDLEAQWQTLKDKNKAIKPLAYKMSESFEARTPILHKVLGWGFIISNQNDRLEVLFQQGIKFLISNYKA